MVKSYTALRTHIKQVYGLSSTKTEKGLFVVITPDQVSEEDKLCYGCEKSSNGVIFSLQGIGIDICSAQRQRVAPTTYRNFLYYCLRHGFDIVAQDIVGPTTPQLLASDTDTELVRHQPCPLASYSTIDIVTAPDSEHLLCKLNYLRYDEANRYKVLFPRVGTEAKIELADLLRLLELLVTEEDFEWKGWGSDMLKQMIRDGTIVNVFTAQEQKSGVLEKGVWD